MAKLKCYYEVLEVARVATQDELKKAYRKQALIWHPDKNQHQLQLADERFKELNHAYTILSDPNERKWYDDHRDAILRGTDDDSSHINLWAYFSTACYDAFDDSERGFYTVYGKVFYDIQGEEIEADDDFQATSNAAASRIRSVPMFGKSDADSNDVLKFYQYWREFVTKKRFTMADKYNTTEAPNRQIKRLMEKENQKERQFARQEYQDQVRHLVEFIYKRDKRVIETIKKIRLEEEERRVKEEEERIKREAEHREAIKLHRQQQQEEYERQKREGVRFMEDDAEYEEVPEFYCVICEKTFRSSSKLDDHERSNLHKKNLKTLRQAVSIDGVDNIEQEIDNFQIDASSASEDERASKQVNDLYTRYDKKEETDSDYEEPHGMVKKGKKSKGKNKSKKAESDEDEDGLDSVQGLANKKSKGKSNNKGNSKVDSEEEEEEVIGLASKKGKKKEKKKNVITLEVEDSDDQEDKVDEEEDDSEDEMPTKSKSKSKSKSKVKQPFKSPFLDSDSEDDKQKSQPKKVGKAKEKRLQREEKKKQEQTKEDFKCHVCSEDFQTRNKLFQHIKDTKHAQATVTNNNAKKK